ncbi:hypothetical protein [Streptomyces cinereoruber]|uniref:hypothetical protein n=1 Tax=Streptomyces cinereoruber TaxID=67260 RepID=UPI0033909940
MARSRSRAVREREARRRRTAALGTDTYRPPVRPAPRVRRPAGRRARLRAVLRGQGGGPGPVARFLLACLAAFFLVAGGVMGVVGASSMGWAGTPGVFTARECHLESSGRGGKNTSCSGTFVPDDGTLTDGAAVLAWPGGRAGRETRVRTVLLGGYQRQDAQEVLFALIGTGALGVLGAGCGFASLPARLRARLVDAAWPVRP